MAPAGRKGPFTDCLTGRRVKLGSTLMLQPYEVLWLDATGMDDA